MPRKKKPHRINRKMRNSTSTLLQADYLLAIAVLVLTMFGVLMVYNTSVIVAFEQIGDKYWFLKHQTIWVFVGVIGGYIISQANYQWLRKYSVVFIIVSIILLMLVFVPFLSSEVYGARQRIVIPGIPFLNYLTIQPSEIVKLTGVIYFASIFSNIKDKLPHMHYFLVLLLIVVLVAIEPDLGNAVLILGSGIMVYFAAGVNLLTLSLVLLTSGVAALIFALSSEYRRQRILTFLNPLSQTESVSYHIQQIFIALGSGGLFGLGLGNSRQKYQYIPEVMTDSIFAIIGEELGLLGAVVIIGILLFIIWRGFQIALHCRDEFGKLLAIGITANIGLQTIVNLGGMVGLMPLTGVPLPFISYGGSSLTILLFSVGILINISRSSANKNAKLQ